MGKNENDFQKLSKVLWNRIISLETKERILDSYVISVLQYESLILDTFITD